MKLASAAERPLVAVVGGGTLLAREIRDVLTEEKPSPRVQLVSAAADGSTILAAEDDEAVVMIPLNAQSLDGVKVAFLAASPATSRRAAKLTPAGGPLLVDLTGALEEQPHARLRAPSAEPSSAPPVSAPVQVIAHPASIALAMLLTRLAQASPLRRSVVHIFEPASERGQRGLDELQQQTVAVLSFKKLKTDVFDAQLGFNMLARYGEEALEPLEGVEQRVERHLASLLAAWPGVPMPSLRVIQAPVFHGHSFSVWAEFETNPDVDALSRELARQGVDLRPDDPPTNAGITGHSGISVGAIAPDRNNSRACWLWLVADNLRLAAENSVAVAREVL
jgi:aspartate-semialdehyde dehydrogenase